MDLKDYLLVTVNNMHGDFITTYYSRHMPTVGNYVSIESVRYKVLSVEEVTNTEYDKLGDRIVNVLGHVIISTFNDNGSKWT